MSAPQTSTYTVSSGLRLEVDHWGAPDAPPVVFLHGGGQTRHSWGGTARALAGAGWHSITVDLRGHGSSDWSPEADYQLSSFAADVVDILGHLPEPPVLVGASLGGLTGMVLEGRVAPGSLAALVLVDIVPNMSPAGADRVLEFMSDRVHAGFATLEEVADAVAAYNPHRPRPTDHRGLEKNLRWRNGRWYWHWDPAFVEFGGDGDAREARDPAFLAEACAAVGVPLLLVRGRMSDLVTAEGAREFLDTYPHADYVDVSGAGHMVAGDRNDVFTTAIIDFMESLRT